METRWIASVSAAAFHVASVAEDGALAAASMESALRPPAEALLRELRTLGIEPGNAWVHLVPMATDIANKRQLAEMLLRRLHGLNCPSRQIEQLAGRLTDLEIALKQFAPDLLDELELRSKPLRQLWDARGPGLLRRASQLTDEDILMERATVLLMPPAAGGTGAAHLSHNSVRIEAVLANPNADLPEVIRLGWLFAQLNLNLPVFSRHVQPQRVAMLARLAMLPATLRAAEHVELVQFSQALLEAAVATWCPELDQLTGKGSILVDWWSTFEATRPSLAVGLAALDRMLPSAAEISQRKPDGRI